MAAHRFKNKKNADSYAKRMRKKGYSCSVYKKDKGYGVSVTKK